MENHIIFLDEDDHFKQVNYTHNHHSIYLFDPFYNINFFDVIPKNFTISTNNGIFHFNKEMIKDTSTVISEFIDTNNDSLEYHLELDDQNNVFAKFEQIYQGNIVIFNENDLKIFNEIVQLLNLNSIPKIEEQQYLNESVYFSTIVISKKSLYYFISDSSFQTFTIITNNHEYKCNLFGIVSSKVISDFLKQNPNENKFIYNYEDDFKEFQLICNFFNFEKTNITVNNMESLKFIAEDLQITYILDDINKNINDNSKLRKTIDEEQNEIDSIDELFDYLYNIKGKTVQVVKKFIEKSQWSQTIENVQELSSFIYQVINSDFLLHKEILDLLLQFDSESNDDNNKLHNLLPLLIKLLMKYFGESKNNCSFVYNLYKNGMISKSEIDKKIIENKKINNVVDWFLPEVSKNSFSLDFNGSDQMRKMFLRSFCRGRINEYNKMRDSGEPDNIIAIYIRNDDVESLKKIIVNDRIDILKSVIGYNIYDDFNFIVQPSFLNYAAAYGSIKCFKFLLLNHAEINPFSFECAVYGGNDEIIRIVDQKSKEIPQVALLKMKTNVQNKIIPCIKKHRNDLFDWIFDEKIKEEEKTRNFFNNLAKESSINGNVHSLIEIIIQGYEYIDYQMIISNCAQKGFCTLLQIVLNIFSNEIEKIDFGSIRNSFLTSDNLSIFKLFSKYMNQIDFDFSFKYAVQYNCLNIIEYIFDNLLGKKFGIQSTTFNEIFNLAISNYKFFNYLIDKFQQLNPLIFKQVLSINECFQETNNSVDYKEEFINSFIYKAIQYKNKELIEVILTKNAQFEYILIEAVNTNDIQIVELILKYNNKTEIVNKLSRDGTPLIIAVNNNNIHIVQSLLKLDNIDPNICFKSETPLMIAVRRNNVQIIEILIKDSRVDTSIKNNHNEDACKIALSKYRINIIKIFADNGDVKAMFEYGRKLFNRDNQKEAARYFKMAADKGHVDSMLNYGEMLRWGDGIPTNKEKAAQYLKKSSDNGNVDAMNSYAYMLIKGEGIPANQKEAAKYFKMAAGKGKVISMFNYGRMSFHGDGIPINNEESFKYFKQAADNGDQDAMVYISFMYDKGIGTAINQEQSQRYYKMALKNCESSVFNTIGILHCSFATDTKDYEKAFEFYKKASDAGYSYGKINYAFMLEYGIGTAIDKEKANQLFKIDIDSGAKIIFNLAKTLELGKIKFPINQKEASAHYYKMAADAGCIESIVKYAEILEKGDYLKANKEEAIRYYKMAADKGNSEAMKKYKSLINDCS